MAAATATSVTATPSTLAEVEASMHITVNWYEYDPSLPTAIVGAILFGIVGFVTLFQFFQKRCWFWWPLVLGTMMEMAGYIARAPSSKYTDNKNMYIVQLVMIILAPGIMAAACYMAMGRLILHLTPPSHLRFRTLWVPARFITPTFVLFDVLSFGIQLVGSSVVASASITDFDRVKRGSRIVEIGLAVQLVCFGFFSFVAARFSFVARRWESAWPGREWLKLLYAINAACAIILLRSIYRMVEFAGGRDGYVRTHEWPFWVFDSFLIWCVLLVFTLLHPADFLPNVGLRKTVVKRTDIEGAGGHEMLGSRISVAN
ncbi:uncharacterized protein H6S33_005426 [Morchella sextelata]|uniref:uncharacterized protein n=1 Tax=Morchella sextelata TaxID=1174677 RepID=UPI001D03701A|nr:uncharacterized protein H6S33_005426 [Morchella sextelata]KAH0613540.1 hypothetical protein H6S33_005426 [Morchella sextelata]